MSTNHRPRTVSFGIVAVLAVALSAPIAVYAEDQMLPAEEQVLAPASVPGPSATTTSVEASRVNAAQHVLLSGDLGSLQEETLMAVVAAAPSWDETSGYGAVEASRAGASALLAPVAGPTWDETSGYGAVEASRATNAQQALQSHDLGSMQEEALAAIVAAAISWDDTSGYGAVEASRAADALGPTRAERLAQFRAIELGLSRDLGAEHPAVSVNPSARTTYIPPPYGPR